eukprot:m.87540 g.87540  ORF g.87540 m.87540 type:complete len:319 (+) comp13115_c0_seq2:91-1047(+)
MKESIGPTLPPSKSSIGPALPPTQSIGPTPPPSKSSIGPTLPPSSTGPTPTSQPIGPTPPSSGSIGAALPPSTSPPTQQSTCGPSLPPGFNKKGPTMPPEGLLTKLQQQDESDDEIVGPVFDPTIVGKQQEENIEDTIRRIENRAKATRKAMTGEQQTVEREEWMTSLPSTNRKNFGTGARDFRQKAMGEQDSSWTETPEQRRQKMQERLERQAAADAMPPSKRARQQEEPTVISKRDLQLRAEIERHNGGARSKSLLDEHMGKRAKEPDANVGVKKPFNRETDLNLSRVDRSKLKNMVESSKEFQSRFSHGRSGQFL